MELSSNLKMDAMTFDNTIDARIERLKPLIRKEIASKFGVGELEW